MTLVIQELTSEDRQRGSSKGGTQGALIGPIVLVVHFVLPGRKLKITPIGGRPSDEILIRTSPGITPLPRITPLPLSVKDQARTTHVCAYVDLLLEGVIYCAL